VNVALWIVQFLLAAVFAVVGVMKLARTREQLATAFAWVQDFPALAVKTLGVLEILVALGLILPPITDNAPVLTSWAAVGGFLLAAGGTVVHLRRGERSLAAPNLLYLAALVLVAWGRFGPYSF
jgi:uncharacterized membrane protein